VDSAPQAVSRMQRIRERIKMRFNRNSMLKILSQAEYRHCVTHPSLMLWQGILISLKHDYS
jgi:hypothetical protein